MAEQEGDGEEKTIVVGAGDTAEEEIFAGEDEEEEEMDGGWDGGGGGGDGIFLPPPGFRFAPTEDEMIRYYLLPKLQGREYVPNNAIIEDTVYQCHPDELTCKYMDRGQGRSWYFLSPRERKYKNGVRPRRDTKDLRGRWKASTGKREKGGDDDDVVKKEKVAGDGTTKYCRSGLAYFHFQGSGAKEKKSGWLMLELTVPEYEIKLPENGGPGGPMLDRYVMYKIYPAPGGKKKRKDDDEAGPSNAELVESDDEGETAELPPMLSEKMAGKRPVSEDQQLCNPTAVKKKRVRRSNRLQIEPPAPPPPPPPQGNGMQATFRMLGYNEGSGQPMGYQAGAPTQLPLVPYNNGQVRQQVAYNGQVPMTTRQPAAYNGQMPVRQQKVAYNGQVPMMTRQPAAYNGQMPVTQQQQVAFNCQVRPPPYGQNQTMMTRPSCPAGQAVKPQMQKQPETDEMLEKRVLQQNLEEYLWMQQQEQRQIQQQQRTMVLMMQQQQQQTYFGGSNADCHHLARGPQFSLDDFYASLAAEHYRRSRAVLPATSGSPGEAVLPATSGSPGEAAPVKAEGSPVSTVVSAGGSGDSSNNGNHDRAESAAVKDPPGGSGSASAEGAMGPNTVGLSDRCSIL